MPLRVVEGAGFLVVEDESLGAVVLELGSDVVETGGPPALPATTASSSKFILLGILWKCLGARWSDPPHNGFE